MYRTRHYQTMRFSFEQICQGERAWTALGNFMNHWYANHFDERERLVVDPLPDEYPQEYHQWAAFCAASVVWFCSSYELPCPSWADNPRYVLPEPWYMYENTRPSFQEYLRKSTAEEFTRYNIYCGNSVYKNKYECDEEGWPLRSHPVDLQERRELLRGAWERLARKWVEQDRMIIKHLPTAEALLDEQKYGPLIEAIKEEYGIGKPQQTQ